MKKLKKFILLTITIFLLGGTCYFLDPITDYLANVISKGPSLVMKPENEYTKNKDYLYVQRSKDYIPYSYQDLLNIIYTTIDNGWETFTFYCPKEYQSCLTDIEAISNDEATYTHINNYVHPFNSFNKIKITMSESGEITLNINYLYTTEEIIAINTAVDKVISENITDNMDDYDKIKTIHDYIVNHTKYDVERNEKNDSPYESYTAYGPIIQGFATCNGYTDLMAIFLTKLGFDNYKIATTPDLISYSSTGHVWNAVYYDHNWVHIDLTWDDPVDKEQKDYLFHTYFLVTTEAMHEADKGETVIEEHNFNSLYYLEFNDYL